ncbi:MAG: pyruvate kinase [Patescibacteria group bacterium]|nr:pyruvate kinase [Patescibacteria group bacterium]
MIKLTKIIATIGPSCESEEVIRDLILAGVDIFRLNFKHNTPDWHRKVVKKISAQAKKLNWYVATLIDLQGPEVRLKILTKDSQIRLSRGKKLLVGDEVDFSHPSVLKEIKNDQLIIVDDGAFLFRSLWSNGKLFLVSERDGVLEDRKTANFPNLDLNLSSLTERDLEGVALACQERIDFIALSFVRSAKDIQNLKRRIRHVSQFLPKVVAKIETEKAIKNIDEIIESADGVMVARGDMGVELPIEQVPYYQKLIIKKAKEQGRFVITATQMLKSMVNSTIPTRAEVSDVANACYDETDVVMLSEETATGRYPVVTVKKMKEIILFNENKFPKKFKITSGKILEKEEIIAENVVSIINLPVEESKKIQAIIVFTETGKTARVISSFRPHLPIIAVVPDEKTALGLMAHYGIYPIVYSEDKGKEITLSSINKVIRKVRSVGFVFQNALVIHGNFWRVKGKISVMRFY